MVQHLIVPVDGSPESWRAFDVALALAERTNSDIRVVEVVDNSVDGRAADRRLNDELHDRGAFAVDVTTDVRLRANSVADELAKLVELQPGAVIVMSSHGKGRSAALVGSVTEDVLRQTFGPIVLVGPQVVPNDFSGPIVVSVDGSHESEIALPLAVAWATEFRTTPWIVHVAEPAMGAPADVFETNYTSRLAKDMHALSERPVEFEELHGRYPAREVSDYAKRLGASMIVASSHGRSGLSRLTVGSITAGLVRNASCPVAVVRLPHPAHPAPAEQPVPLWAY